MKIGLFPATSEELQVLDDLRYWNRRQPKAVMGRIRSLLEKSDLSVKQMADCRAEWHKLGLNTLKRPATPAAAAAVPLFTEAPAADTLGKAGGGG